MPVDGLAELARKSGIVFLLDASQTAGTIPIHLDQLGVDLLAFTGHKGLLGPTGTGGLYIREGLVLDPLMRGGTGSHSASETQPEFLPDAYESGTPNVAGLAGLAAGVRFLLETGVVAVTEQERLLTGRFLAGASEIPGVVIYGKETPRSACGIVSFNVEGASPSEVCVMLDQSFGIMARPGLHCAPSAHRTLGTFPAGTVRFSFGWFNSMAEVDTSVNALAEIALWSRRRS